MMRPRDERLSVYVCTQAMDFRKGMASLAVLVEAQLGLNPFTKSLYVFRNRSATAVTCCIGSATAFACGRNAWSRNDFVGPRGMLPVRWR